MIEEGKRRTQQVIDNDPVLSFMLRLRDQSEPRGLPALTAHILASSAKPRRKVRTKVEVWNVSKGGRLAARLHSTGKVEVGLPGAFQGKISSASQ
ncbi:hypothetical protein ACWDG1_13390 [Streptomyces sp. NPDC001177]